MRWAGAGQAQAGTKALQAWPGTLTGLSRGAIRQPRRSHPGPLVQNNVVTSRVPGGHSHRLGIGAAQPVRGRSGHGHFPKATITQLVLLIKENCVTCVSGSDWTRTLGGKQNRQKPGPCGLRVRGGRRRLRGCPRPAGAWRAREKALLQGVCRPGRRPGRRPGGGPGRRPGGGLEEGRGRGRGEPHCSR